MGRDDILFIAGVPQEDPAVIAEAADIVMYADEIKQGDSIMETAPTGASTCSSTTHSRATWPWS